MVLLLLLRGLLPARARIAIVVLFRKCPLLPKSGHLEKKQHEVRRLQEQVDALDEDEDEEEDEDGDDDDDDEHGAKRKRVKSRGGRNASAAAAAALSPGAAVPAVTDQDLVLFEVSFSEEVMAHLGELFNLLDTQKQGFITSASFTAGVGLEYMGNFGVWTTIKHHFDEDGNDAIDPREFVTGFARLGLEKVRANE